MALALHKYALVQSMWAVHRKFIVRRQVLLAKSALGLRARKSFADTKYPSGECPLPALHPELVRYSPHSKKPPRNGDRASGGFSLVETVSIAHGTRTVTYSPYSLNTTVNTQAF